MRGTVILFALVINLAAVLSQGTNTPNFISLPVVVHDYFPCVSNEWVNPPPNGKASLMTMANCMPDIEPHQTSTSGWGYGLGSANKGMVSNTLDSNRKMVYVMPTVAQTATSPKYQTAGATSFNKWWDSTWAGNDAIKYNFTLNMDGNTGLYTISTGSFYPIDNQGWGNNGYLQDLKKHNWGFCVEAHGAFVYNSSATLSFEGDDDMWIFMNNQLVFDIGGIHTPVKQTTRLGDFQWSSPMVQFKSYPFDMFYCERQSLGSDIILTTTVNIYCPNNQFDYCGTCQGKGDCCPACVAPDACTIATLDPRTCACSMDTTTIPNRCAIQSDACNTVTCSAAAGGCKATPKSAPPITGCQTGSCDTKLGWVVKSNPDACPTNSTQCFPSTCTPSTADQTKASCTYSTKNECLGQCINEPCPTKPCTTLQCFNDASATLGRNCVYTSTLPQNNTCVGYTCAADGFNYTSVPLLVCSNSSNLCYNSVCDVSLRGCTARVYKNCNDSNLCTIDTCQESTGTCVYTPVTLPSSNNTCILSSCDPQYGTTSTDIDCKGLECSKDPTVDGCCICKGLPIAGIVLGAGAIAGIAIGGAAVAGVAAFGGKKAHDYFSGASAAAAGTQNNPMYVGNQSGGANPMYEGGQA